MSKLVRVPLKRGVFVMMPREEAIRLGYVKAEKPAANKMVGKVRDKGRK